MTALFVEGNAINGGAFIYDSCGLIGLLIFLSIVYQHLDFGNKSRILQKLAIFSVYTSLLLTHPMI